MAISVNFRTFQDGKEEVRFSCNHLIELCESQPELRNKRRETAEDQAVFHFTAQINSWYPIYQLILREQTEAMKLVMRNRFPQYFGVKNIGETSNDA